MKRPDNFESIRLNKKWRDYLFERLHRATDPDEIQHLTVQYEGAKAAYRQSINRAWRELGLMILLVAVIVAVFWLIGRTP